MINDIHYLAQLYINDLNNTLKLMIKPRSFHYPRAGVEFNPKLITHEDLVTDSFIQHYDQTDERKTFKFSFNSSYKSDVRFSKLFYINDVKHNEQDFPSRITYWPINEQIMFEYFQNNMLHRTKGPAYIIYDCVGKEILKTIWIVKDKHLNEQELKRWFDLVDLPKNLYKFTDEAIEVLFNLQILNNLK